jgi:hypothetical protein
MFIITLIMYIYVKTYFKYMEYHLAMLKNNYVLSILAYGLLFIHCIALMMIMFGV